MASNVLLTILLVFIGYLIIKKTLTSIVQRVGFERGINPDRIRYVLSVLNFSLGVFAILIVGALTGIGYKQFSFFMSSVLAILGVALFAQWSILSNITASVMVFFFFPYRVGDYVKILDGENTIEGKIIEIALFHVILNDEKGKLITFPNSMVFQKAVVIERGVGRVLLRTISNKNVSSATTEKNE